MIFLSFFCIDICSMFCIISHVIFHYFIHFLCSRFTGRKLIVYWGQCKIFSVQVLNWKWRVIVKNRRNKYNFFRVNGKKFSDLVNFYKYRLFCEHWNVTGKTGFQWEMMHFLEYTFQLPDSGPVGVILQPCEIIPIYRQQICSVSWRFRWRCSFSMEKASFCVFVSLFHQCFFGLLVWMSYNICLLTSWWMKSNL